MKRVIVITGATGTGKTTVSSYLTEHFNIPRIITHTTRPKRPGEQEGVDYYFETPDTFKQNHYLESVTYANYQYGSSLEGLARAFSKSDVVSIVLDTKGAETYVHELKSRVTVLFLTVAHPLLLEERLKQRGDQLEMVKNRLKSDEYRRDLKLPSALKGVAKIMQNDDWQKTQLRLNKFIASLIETKSPQA